MVPRVPFPHFRAFSASTTRAGIAATAAIALAGVVANASVAILGIPEWGPAWRQGFHLTTVAIVTITSTLLIWQDAVPTSQTVRVIPVLFFAIAWIALRLAPDTFGMEAAFGRATANAPLEVAVITFFGARYFKWPEHWLPLLCVISYATYAFLPSTVPSAVREMPVTFSFILFTCVVFTWCIRGWKRNEEPAKHSL